MQYLQEIWDTLDSTDDIHIGLPVALQRGTVLIAKGDYSQGGKVLKDTLAQLLAAAGKTYRHVNQNSGATARLFISEQLSFCYHNLGIAAMREGR